MLGFANRLRQDGIDALIDQYNPAPPLGWPQWMTREIQAADFVVVVCTETYLQRVEGREEPGKGRGVLWEAKLIYNLLYPEETAVQRFIPILFADGQPSSIPLPLRGLTQYRVDTEQGYEVLYRHLTDQPRNLKPQLGALRSLPPKKPRSYPSSQAAKRHPKRPSSLDKRHRTQLLKQVRLDWIEGVLNQSLYKVARLELGLTNKADAVEQPLNAVIQVPDRAPMPILPGTPISQIFDEQAGALLILGAPGTGKTTLLLELAQDLLDRADHDECQPIPVIFPLSSWAVRRQRLTEWLITELNQRSYVPKKVARQWVESEQILPLLDGLDEVAVQHRAACVEAINQFRREQHGLLHIAVCSRITDYEILGTKLRLGSAVEVQPLARPQIQNYLASVGEPLLGLRTGLQADLSLWELLETPLMLWVAMLAYRDVPLASLEGNTVEQKQHHLFAQFVEAMFRRRSSQRRYPPEQTKVWLCWLACTLIRSNQVVFYLENLDFGWLATRTHKWLAQAGVVLATGLFSGLIFGLCGWLIFGLSDGMVVGLTLAQISGLIFGSNDGLIGGLIGGLSYGLMNGLSGGLIFGLSGGLTFGLSSVLVKLQPVEQTRFGSTNVSHRVSVALHDGLIFGLIGGLIVGLIFGLIGGLRDGLAFGLIFGLTFTLIFGLIFGLTFGLIRLFTSEANPETRFVVNQGTRRSVMMAGLVGLIFGLSVGLIGGWTVGPIGGLLFGLSDGVSVGLISGLIFGLFSGGLYSAKHYGLRLFLWFSRASPLHYVPFLAHAKELLFLREVGGGYIFTHRLLREYFASLAQAEEDSEPNFKAASAASSR